MEITTSVVPMAYLCTEESKTECYTMKKSNWVQTISGKGRNKLLPLYSPLEPWIKKTWRPSEIELVK